jgi:hypothetical protein
MFICIHEYRNICMYVYMCIFSYIRIFLCCTPMMKWSVLTLYVLRTYPLYTHTEDVPCNLSKKYFPTTQRIIYYSCHTQMAYGIKLFLLQKMTYEPQVSAEKNIQSSVKSHHNAVLTLLIRKPRSRCLQIIAWYFAINSIDEN